VGLSSALAEQFQVKTGPPTSDLEYCEMRTPFRLYPEHILLLTLLTLIAICGVWVPVALM